jgi:hypothetical protein
LVRHLIVSDSALKDAIGAPCTGFLALAKMSRI